MTDMPIEEEEAAAQAAAETTHEPHTHVDMSAPIDDAIKVAVQRPKKKDEHIPIMDDPYIQSVIKDAEQGISEAIAKDSTLDRAELIRQGVATIEKKLQDYAEIAKVDPPVMQAPVRGKIVGGNDDIALKKYQPISFDGEQGVIQNPDGSITTLDGKPDRVILTQTQVDMIEQQRQQQELNLAQRGMKWHVVENEKLTKDGLPVFMPDGVTPAKSYSTVITYVPPEEQDIARFFAGVSACWFDGCDELRRAYRKELDKFLEENGEDCPACQRNTIRRRYEPMVREAIRSYNKKVREEAGLPPEPEPVIARRIPKEAASPTDLHVEENGKTNEQPSDTAQTQGPIQQPTTRLGQRKSLLRKGADRLAALFGYSPSTR